MAPRVATGCVRRCARSPWKRRHAREQRGDARQTGSKVVEALRLRELVVAEARKVTGLVRRMPGHRATRAQRPAGAHARVQTSKHSRRLVLHPQVRIHARDACQHARLSEMRGFDPAPGVQSAPGIVGTRQRSALREHLLDLRFADSIVERGIHWNAREAESYTFPTGSLNDPGRGARAGVPVIGGSPDSSADRHSSSFPAARKG